MLNIKLLFYVNIDIYCVNYKTVVKCYQIFIKNMSFVTKIFSVRVGTFNLTKFIMFQALVLFLLRFENSVALTEIWQ